MDRTMHAAAAGITHEGRSAAPTGEGRIDVPAGTVKIRMTDGWLYYGDTPALKDINVAIPDRAVTALMGPSGCGKTTFLNILNRMIDVIPGARFKGKCEIGDLDIYTPGIDPVDVRRRYGVVAQRPNPFPSSIWYNIAYGPRINGLGETKAELDPIVEDALRRAWLWDEVKDRLEEDATGLSGGQQQRLCVARAIATGPEVVLMDEPTASIDPIATRHVEELMVELSRDFAIIVVTHNLMQARRVSDWIAYFHLGHLLEFRTAGDLLDTPHHHLTRAFVEGRYG